MKNKGNKLAVKMLIALIFGLLAGVSCIYLRENVLSAEAWAMVNSLLFQDITAEGAESAIGLFYIVGQLFVNALQLIIVPMVFTSITLAICTITDTKKLGRISSKTLLTFLITTICALGFAAVVGTIAYNMGVFDIVNADLSISAGSTGSNPLKIILGIVPNNLVSAFSNNGGVLLRINFLSMGRIPFRSLS